MAFSIRLLVLTAVALLLSSGTALAQPLSSVAADCMIDAPDSVETSWSAPCKEGDWVYDGAGGCRMWDWRPQVRDSATWTGACLDGEKNGIGVVQWFEGGAPIDRFEGGYIAGRRQGFGRYAWNTADRFDGHYVDDVPNGLGTAVIGGTTFIGTWKRGCLWQLDWVVAIGVPRTSCMATGASSGGPPLHRERRGNGERW